MWLIYGGVLTLGLLLVLLFVIPVLIQAKKTLRAVNNLIASAEEEAKPILQGVREILLSVNRGISGCITRAEQMTNFLDMVAGVNSFIEILSGRARRAARPSVRKLISWLTGLKRG